jgi:Ca-activated chloride channel homolog
MKPKNFVMITVITATFCACSPNAEEEKAQTDSVVAYDLTPSLTNESAPPPPPPPKTQAATDCAAPICVGASTICYTVAGTNANGCASGAYTFAWNFADVNTEEYSPISENKYHSSKTDPLSTFAIDVDGASYTNVRKKLMDGIMPDADAVRVEEFINYFNYTYPKPTGTDPFAISTEYAKCPWNGKHTLLQIGLKGKELDPLEAAPNNLVFLVDVSGSMEDQDKLPLLKRAFKLLVPKLRPQDRISMVVYAGNAGMIINGVHGSEKDEIYSSLESLEAGGSTAGGEGINLAYRIAKENYMKNGNNRVILATDGDFNVGVSSDDELEKLITEKRSDGIYLSVLGFGQGNIKDSKMETLADKGNGNYYFIDNILEARKVLVSQFGGTMSTIAKDVKIQVEFNPAKVKEYRLIGYENRALAAEDFNDDKKDAGEMGSGHCVTALYEIIPAGSDDSKTNIDALKYSSRTISDGPDELATVKFRYKGAKKNDTISRLITKVVYPATETTLSQNMRLASAATEFAMLLRNSPEKGITSYEHAVAMAASAKINDVDGYISGLIDLIRIAKDVSMTDKKLE